MGMVQNIGDITHTEDNLKKMVTKDSDIDVDELLREIEED
jgi:hypothetical protein